MDFAGGAGAREKPAPEFSEIAFLNAPVSVFFRANARRKNPIQSGPGGLHTSARGVFPPERLADGCKRGRRFFYAGGAFSRQEQTHVASGIRRVWRDAGGGDVRAEHAAANGFCAADGAGAGDGPGTATGRHDPAGVARNFWPGGIVPVSYTHLTLPTI